MLSNLQYKRRLEDIVNIEMSIKKGERKIHGTLSPTMANARQPRTQKITFIKETTISVDH